MNDQKAQPKEYQQKDADRVPDTTEINSRKDMPIKNAGTDSTQNTAGEEGLNQAISPDNDLEPGTASGE